MQHLINLTGAILDAKKARRHPDNRTGAMYKSWDMLPTTYIVVEPPQPLWLLTI